MTKLNISLVILVVLLWGGHIIYYFRVDIFRWLDSRIHYEPYAERLRSWLKLARK